MGTEMTDEARKAWGLLFRTVAAKEKTLMDNSCEPNPGSMQSKLRLCDDPFDHEAMLPKQFKAGANLPTIATDRKAIPLCTGVLDYFPDALCAVAELSRIGNDQHNPGEPLHWAKDKSTDEPDALLRHLIDRGTRDTDGVRHSAKVAWRALALLQREIEAERG
jgi:hypothetical protein